MKPILILFLVLSSYAFSQEWKLEKEDNGIKIFSKKTDTSKFKEFKAIVKVRATLDEVKNFILDANNLYKWNHKTSESKLIKQISSSESVIWMVNEFSWPFKNRDNVSRLKVQKYSKNSIIINISPETTVDYPERENTIRITDFNGHWLLEEKENYVEITQQMYGNPKTNFSGWLVNNVIINSLFRTFTNLSEEF